MAGPPADDLGNCKHVCILVAYCTLLVRGEGSLRGVDLTPLVYIILHLSFAEGYVPPNGKERETNMSKTLTVVT